MSQHQKDDVPIWAPREHAVGDQVAQYSRFVSWMKLALPIAAGVLLLAVVVLPMLRKDDERFRIGMNMIKGASTDTLSMTNARYFGTDDKGQPFAVTATGVRQHAQEDHQVDLIGPHAEIKLEGGEALSASAGAGLYHRDLEKLDLSDGVTVVQNKDNQLRTKSAVVMLKEGSASGREAVSSEGPYGTMQAAGGFDLTERGKIVKFIGPAKLVLKSGAEPATPAAPIAPEKQ
jgi:lipopolysaccharide export system protein LptC